MKVHLLLARNKSRYPGQYQLEVLEAVTEYQLSDYPSLIENRHSAYASQEWELYGTVVVEVDECAIKERLRQGPIDGRLV